MEFATLTVLISLADHRTGCGRINAPALRDYLPDLSRDAAKRTLQGLQEKGYIFREIVGRSTRKYRYWVGRYEPSEGRFKMLQTVISKALVSNDPNDVFYDFYNKPAPEGALEDAPETAPEGAPLNNKEQAKKEHAKTPVPINQTCDITGATDVADGASSSVGGMLQRSGSIEQGDAPMLPQCCAYAVTDAAEGSQPQGVGLRWNGEAGAYLDTQTGRAASFDELKRRIAPLGLEWREGKFYAAGSPVARELAEGLICGQQAAPYALSDLRGMGEASP